MRNMSLIHDRKGVSQILGYLLSFSIAFIVMTSSIFIVTSIIDDKKRDVASLQAQMLANQLADIIIEAASAKQQDMDYQKKMDLPDKIGGKSYYVDVTNDSVYVNTTDGSVSKKVVFYNISSLVEGIYSRRIYVGGSREINVYVNHSEYIYRFDFGTGNTSSHSPVATGYYMVTNTSTSNIYSWSPAWYDPHYKYRIPIRINNNSSKYLRNYLVRITLTPDNFDYERAYVNFISPSEMVSDLVFVYQLPSYNTLYVNQSYNPATPGWGVTRFNNIQDAIDNASAGDTIIVYRGVYNGSLLVDKPLSLIGESREETIIRYPSSIRSWRESALEIKSDYVNIDGFTISASNVSGLSGKIVVFNSSSYCVISNCTVLTENPHVPVGLGTGYGIGNSIWDGVVDVYSSHNIISNCSFYNTGGGVHLYWHSSDYLITDCVFDTNCTTFEFSRDCNNITITHCYIKNASGILSGNSFRDLVFTNCTVEEQHGNHTMFISDVANFTVYANNFINCSCNFTFSYYGFYDPKELHFNVSYDNYPYCGNYWSNYTGYDNYSGPSQDHGFSDGIWDNKYEVANGVYDYYPNVSVFPTAYPKRDTKIQGYPFLGVILPYSIEYWNPYGESTICLPLNLKENSYTYIYLYYGYNKTVSDKDMHYHSIGNPSVFFEDFDDPAHVRNWWSISSLNGDLEEKLNNSYINLTNDDLILTKGPYAIMWFYYDNPYNPGDPKIGWWYQRDYPQFYIPYPPVPDAMNGQRLSNEKVYLVEARMKILSGNSNIILLRQHNYTHMAGGPFSKPFPHDSDYNNSYVVSINGSDTSSFMLHKHNNTLYGPWLLLDDVDTVDITNRWIRIKCYVYLNSTKDNTSGMSVVLNTSSISSYLYTDDQYSYGGNVEMLDNNSDMLVVGDPYMGGSIGLSAGILPGSDESEVWVDWIRVSYVTPDPSVSPTVEVGAMETIQGVWVDLPETRCIPAAEDRICSDPFYPGPILRDFINVTPGANFSIKNLPPGTYTVTVTTGILDYYSLLFWYITWGVKSEETSLVEWDHSVDLPSANLGVFRIKRFTVDIPEEYGMSTLFIQFNSQQPLLSIRKAINSVVIEHGQPGVKIE